MDRRTFIRSTAQVSLATTLTAGMVSTIHANADGALFDELFETVHRYDNSDEHQTATILALLAAKRWGQEMGIQFVWHPMAEMKDEGGRPLYTCRALRGGRVIGRSEEWYETTALDPSPNYARVWAEAELALEIMSDFSSCVDEHLYVDIGNPVPLETDIELDEIIAEQEAERQS